MTDAPPATLFLARHGETGPNREGRLQGGGLDAGLNAQGRWQAERLAEALRHEPLAAVYASPMRRTWQTAEPAARLHGLEIRPVPELVEIGWGTYERRLLSEAPVSEALSGAYARWAAGDLDHALEGGESPRTVAARAVPALDRIAEAHPGEAALVVTHGRLLRILLASVLPGLGPHRMDAVTHANCSLYRLVGRGGGGGYTADYLDRRDHLGGGNGS